MVTSSGGEAMVQALLANGVDTVFGLPGAQMYPLFDALHQAAPKIRTLNSRHEQGVAYMATGYAKASGKPGVYSVVPGPGVLNTTAALSTAWGCNTPVMCLTGQVPSEFLGKGRGHLHEIPDQQATLSSLIKWSHHIESTADVPVAMAEGFRRMLSGRPGPVALEMCWDTMGERAEVAPAQAVTPDPPPEPDPDRIAAAAKLIAGAKRPMIIVGGGAIHAVEEVQALADRLGAPVGAFRAGRGIVPEDHELGVSSLAAHELWADTDLLIGIGSRLELPYMRWTGMMKLVDAPQAPPHLIRIDIDPREMDRLQPHVGIICDAAQATRALDTALAGRATTRADTGIIAEAKARARKKAEDIQPQVAFLDVMRRVMPRDAFFVEELCQVGYASFYAFPIYQPRTYVTLGFQGTLGAGFPIALGAKVAQPNRPVVAITGDGGFGFGLAELATAVQYNIALVTVLFNNNAYGNVRRDQMQRFQGRALASDLTNPDFVKLAESFGVRAERADGPEPLGPALERALAHDGPSLIEVPIAPDSEVSPWPLIRPRPAS